MPKLEITEVERGELLEALHLSLKSAIRAQNTGRTPQIKEVWKIHEKGTRDMIHKVENAK